jgi:hypothetical protein
MAEQSFTISEWCATRKISKSMFYKLRLQGLGPRCHNAGNKLLISPEADVAWLREREADAIQALSSATTGQAAA